MLSEIEKDVCSYFPYKGIKWKTRKRCRALVPDAPRAVNNPEFSPNVALANQGVSLLSAFARRITITLLSSLWLEITPPARRKGNLKLATLITAKSQRLHDGTHLSTSSLKKFSFFLRFNTTPESKGSDKVRANCLQYLIRLVDNVKTSKATRLLVVLHCVGCVCSKASSRPPSVCTYVHTISLTIGVRV